MLMREAIDAAKEAYEWYKSLEPAEAEVDYKRGDGTEGTAWLDLYQCFQTCGEDMEKELIGLWEVLCREYGSSPDGVVSVILHPRN